MTEKEAKYLIQWLDNVCVNSDISNNQHKGKQYISLLLNLDYNIAHNAIETMICNGLKYFPAAGEILETYNSLKKNSTATIKTGFCYLCENKGFIPYMKDEHQYVAYCHECRCGDSWQYEGQNCKNKSDYRIIAVAQVLTSKEIDEIKVHNAFRSRTPVKPPPELQKALNGLFGGSRLRRAI